MMRDEGQGQISVIMAVGIGTVITLLLFVLNVSALLSSYSALDRTVRDAATAALRTSTAGSPRVDPADAYETIEKVLSVELENVRFMRESVSELVNGFTVVVHNPSVQGGTVVVGGETYHGPVVELALDAHLCPPVFPCIAVCVRRLASLEAAGVQPPTATPVPEVTIEITVTP